MLVPADVINHTPALKHSTLPGGVSFVAGKAKGKEEPKNKEDRTMMLWKYSLLLCQFVIVVVSVTSFVTQSAGTLGGRTNIIINQRKNPNSENIFCFVSKTTNIILSATTTTTKEDDDKEEQEESIPGRISADSIYFEIEVAGTKLGRLIFHLTNPSKYHPINEGFASEHRSEGTLCWL